MATPAIQTLLTDAQQVLNLNSLSEVRATMAAALANANVGTPLNPNLTTQQLWDEFYLIVRQPESDIESIITNQLMKFLFAPPAPGGAGADQQVIFNDGGVLAGDPQFLWNKTTNLLTVTGSATITGDLTVRTNQLKVDSVGVGIGTTDTSTGKLCVNTGDGTVCFRNFSLILGSGTGAGLDFLNSARSAVVDGGMRATNLTLNSFGANPLILLTDSTERYRISSTGVATWSNVGGFAGTAMTLNSTGLGVGDAPAANTRLTLGSVNPTGLNIAFKTTGVTTGRVQTYLSNTSGDLLSGIEGSTAGQTLTGSAAYSAFIGTFTTNPFYLVSNGLIRATLDTSGNVGVGVTPSAWGAAYKAVQQQFGASFFTSNAGSIGLGGNCYNNGTNWLYASGNPATRYEIGPDAGNHRWFIAPSGTAGNAITFTPAMTLTASGDLLVGQTTAGLDANGGIWVRSATSIYGSSIIVNHPTAVGTGNSYSEFTHNGIVIGSISQNGTTGVLYNISSDYRLKEAVQPITDGLSRINALKPSIYKWKSDGSTGEGFLAHELAEVVPFAVSGEKDAVSEDGKIKPQGIDMSRIVPILVAAIKELTARVEALEA